MPDGIPVSRRQRHKAHYDPIAKSKRDVKALRNKARFVIDFTGGKKPHVINNDPKLFPGTTIVPLIAVVANVEDYGKTFPASVLEIGYKRARPYRRVHKNRNKIYLQARKPYRKISREDFEQTYPLLLTCLEEILEETRFTWKSDEPWIFNGKAYERGVQFTVNRADEMLCQALLREAQRYLENCVINDFTFVINWLLRYSQFTSYRTYGSNVQRAVHSMMANSCSQNAFTYEVIMQRIGKRTLLENALLDIESFQSEPNFESRLAFGEKLAEVPTADGMFFWFTPDQPPNKNGTHADNCCRFEMIFDRQNQKSRHTLTRGETLATEEWENHTDEYDDSDDIPF